MVRKKTRAQPAKQEKSLYTADSFQNVLARLGVGMPSLLEATSYPLTRLTQDYTTLNSLYRNHWIVRKIVDVIPEDMCKNWIKLKTQVAPEQLSKLEKVMRRTNTKARILEGLKWGRLYGGAAGIILIDGESNYMEEPLDYRFIMPGSYKGLLILDRWSGISPELELVSDITSPDFGLPKYYHMTLQDGRMLRVHHSRVLRFTGNTLPLWEAWAEQQWGASVVEAVFDELKKRDNTSFNIANLVFLANLRIYKTSMTDLLSLGDAQLQQDFYNAMQTINWMMNNSGMTIIGKDDEFDSKQYTFTGLNDVYESFMLDIAGACEIPVTRLFGRSPAGFNATGESDLTNYYDSIEEKQEAYLAPILDKLLPVIALSTWGMVPDDLDYEFNPLRKADPKENADLAKSMTESVITVFNANLISQQTALKELRQQSEMTGMWSNITDEDIADADTGTDFGGELPGMEGLLRDFTGDAHWDEAKHPRRKDGKFGNGGGGSEEEKPQTKSEKYARIKAEFSYTDMDAAENMLIEEETLWMKGITHEESRGIYDYTNSGYEAINCALRDGKENADVIAQVKRLDSAIAQFDLKHSLSVIRGTSSVTLEKMGLALKNIIGASYSDKGYQSASIALEEVAGEFAKNNAEEHGGDPVLIQLDIPKGKGRGAYIDNLSEWNGEKEFLIKRDASFEFYEKTKHENGMVLLKARWKE